MNQESIKYTQHMQCTNSLSTYSASALVASSPAADAAFGMFAEDAAV